MRPPRYYDKIIADMYEDKFLQIKQKRIDKITQNVKNDNTAERLAVKEKVKLAALASLKRTVENEQNP